MEMICLPASERHPSTLLIDEPLLRVLEVAALSPDALEPVALAAGAAWRDHKSGFERDAEKTVAQPHTESVSTSASNIQSKLRHEAVTGEECAPGAEITAIKCKTKNGTCRNMYGHSKPWQAMSGRTAIYVVSCQYRVLDIDPKAAREVIRPLS